MQQSELGELPEYQQAATLPPPSPAALPQASWGDLGGVFTAGSRAVTPAGRLDSTSQRDLASRCQEQLLNSQKTKTVQTHPVVNWQGS